MQPQSREFLRCWIWEDGAVRVLLHPVCSGQPQQMPPWRHQPQRDFLGRVSGWFGASLSPQVAAPFRHPDRRPSRRGHPRSSSQRRGRWTRGRDSRSSLLWPLMSGPQGYC